MTQANAPRRTPPPLPCGSGSVTDWFCLVPRGAPRRCLRERVRACVRGRGRTSRGGRSGSSFHFLHLSLGGVLSPRKLGIPPCITLAQCHFAPLPLVTRQEPTQTDLSPSSLDRLRGFTESGCPRRVRFRGLLEVWSVVWMKGCMFWKIFKLHLCNLFLVVFLLISFILFSKRMFALLDPTYFLFLVYWLFLVVFYS